MHILPWRVHPKIGHPYPHPMYKAAPLRLPHKSTHLCVESILISTDARRRYILAYTPKILNGGEDPPASPCNSHSTKCDPFETPRSIISSLIVSPTPLHSLRWCTYVAITSSISAVPCRSLPPALLSSTQHLATPNGLSTGLCKKYIPTSPAPSFNGILNLAVGCSAYLPVSSAPLRKSGIWNSPIMSILFDSPPRRGIQFPPTSVEQTRR